jgi:membrane protease YdiL (CAAX protease family)
MNKPGLAIPFIKAGWLRALLFIFVFIILALVIVISAFPKVLNDNAKGMALQDVVQGNLLFVLTFVLFALTIISVYVFRRWVDRKSFISLGLQPDGHAKDSVAGFMLATFIVGGSSLILKATGHLRWMDIIFDARALFLIFGTVLMSSFYEELMFRGYILSNLMDSFPKWLALLISSILFMIFHWSSLGFFPLLNTFIMGLIAGLNYIYTKNLLFSISFHAGWKFLEGPVFGFSGNESFQTLLQTDLHGDANITGGVNGLEGSFILTAVSLLSLMALYLFLQRRLIPGSQPVPGRI